jgi:hypothetical protein
VAINYNFWAALSFCQRAMLVYYTQFHVFALYWGQNSKKVVIFMQITINPYATDTQLVGIIPECIITYYSIQCASLEVYMPPGVLKHLKRRGHWNDFLTYHQDIPDMIANPDYAGQNPKEPNTVEIYKVVNDHVLLPIKLNTANGLFLSSFYILDNGADKIQKRLRVGRIHPFSFFT